MTPQQFIAKWQAVQLSERSACQQHFLDLCELLGQPKPAEADPEGAWYTFERGVRTSTDGQGFADVWMRGKFGWEYKGKRKDLKAAYQQLQRYREDLENPPCLVVCDLDRFEIHTNFTGTAKRVFEFDLAGLAEPANLDVLRKVFTNPEALKPGQTAQAITEQAAEHFGQLADGLRTRGVPAHDAAHFLMKLIFCLFAEDIELLPGGLFTRILTAAKKDPAKLRPTLQALFAAMSTGGLFGADEILYFNGGLFADDRVLDLTGAEIGLLNSVAAFDWSSIEPSIFGTLFERTLDPDKRAQIGAHYTSRTDIETLLNPVMMQPLRREWDAVRTACDADWEGIVAGSRGKGAKPAALKKLRNKFERAILDYDERLADVTVLDPACGSGNFLYVALHLLLGLEKEVIAYAAKRGLPLLPKVLPTQLAGLEINPYAAELAQVAIWIGYLQWMRDNGFSPPSNPVLEPISSIRNQDAILDLSDPDHPQEPEWPPAEFIVGNPPFLGGSKLRSELGPEYTSHLFRIYEGRLSGFSDLCCYWFEKTRKQIENKYCQRAGLLATQGIRGETNRQVIERIKSSGDIFFAIRDRNWVLDGASVHVSVIGFDDGTESVRTIDGMSRATIPSNLGLSIDVTVATAKKNHRSMWCYGSQQKASFDIDPSLAKEFLRSPNPHGRPNSDVLRPSVNGKQILQRTPDTFVVDFGENRSLESVSRYEAPFEWCKSTIFPKREHHSEKVQRTFWWLHARPSPLYRESLTTLNRLLATPAVSKHRVFVWVNAPVLVDHASIIFCNSDDWFMGVLHSRPHEAWSREQATQVRERESGLRYISGRCFETFPFPQTNDAQQSAIAAAAKELDTLRNNWLNPPELVRTEVLEFPGSTDGPWARYLDPATLKPLPDGSAQVGTVRYPRLVPQDDAAAAILKKRTLTNLYNQRPTWLDHAHKKLDAAVFAAYGWDPSISDDDLLAKLLELNLAQA